MAAIDLTAPTIAYLDCAVSSRGPIPNDEMIGEAVLHPADVPMVIIKNARASLSGSAVVHDNKLPAAAHDRRAIDLGAHGARKITIGDFALRPWPPAAAGRRSWGRLVALITQKPRFLDIDLRNCAGAECWTHA